MYIAREGQCILHAKDNVYCAIPQDCQQKIVFLIATGNGLDTLFKGKKVCNQAVIRILPFKQISLFIEKIYIFMWLSNFKKKLLVI